MLWRIGTRFARFGLNVLNCAGIPIRGPEKVTNPRIGKIEPVFERSGLVLDYLDSVVVRC